LGELIISALVARAKSARESAEEIRAHAVAALGRHEHGRPAAHAHEVEVAGPGRQRHEHLVALVHQRGDRARERVLGAVTDRDLFAGR